MKNNLPTLHYMGPPAIVGSRVEFSRDSVTSPWCYLTHRETIAASHRLPVMHFRRIPSGLESVGEMEKESSSPEGTQTAQRVFETHYVAGAGESVGVVALDIFLLKSELGSPDPVAVIVVIQMGLVCIVP